VRQAACRREVLRRASQLNICVLAINLAGKKFERCTETGESVLLFGIPSARPSRRTTSR
jgi:hypothetical protein